MEYHQDVESTKSKPSLTVPSQVGSLKKNGYVILNNHPCKIIEIIFSKIGKIGLPKAKITVIDLFTWKKYEEIHRSSLNIDVPVTTSEEWTLIDISRDGFASLMGNNGDIRDDIKVPDNETGLRMRTLLDNGITVSCTVLSTMGRDIIFECKEI